MAPFCDRGQKFPFSNAVINGDTSYQYLGRMPAERINLLQLGIGGRSTLWILAEAVNGNGVDSSATAFLSIVANSVTGRPSFIGRSSGDEQDVR